MLRLVAVLTFVCLLAMGARVVHAQWPTQELEQELAHRYDELGGELAPRDREFKAIRRARRYLEGNEVGHRGLKRIRRACIKLDKARLRAGESDVLDAANRLLSNLRVAVMDRFDALQARVDALPPEHRSASFGDKRRKLVERLERDAAAATPAKLNHQAERIEYVHEHLLRLEKQVARAEKKALPYTDPERPFNGKGTVTISVFDGPKQTLAAGIAGMHDAGGKNRGISLGTSDRIKPWIQFHHDGKYFKGVGVYPVAEHPLVWGDDFERDFANGFFKAADNTFYRFTSGTLWITKLNTKRRRLTGIFDVIGESDDGREIGIKGTFDLCDWGIEYRDRISLAE